MKQEKSIAQERIRKLFKRAHEVWYKDKALSQRYIEIARNIGMHCNVRLSRTVQQYFCKKCSSILIPGTSCRVRVRPECGTKLAITCLECGAVKRFSQLKEEEKVRNKTLRRESTSLRPTIWIGKGGVDQNIIDQVKTQIKAKRLIKIKVQQPAYNQDNLEKIIDQVIEKANVILIDKRGRTFIVAKD